MAKEEKKQSYWLVIMRRDGEHISILEDTDYDKVIDEYKVLTDRWASCVKESIPFHLSKPVVTTFDPTMIYEITVKPIVETIGSTNRHDNPYQQAMHKNGLSHTINNPQLLSEIKDGGYR